MRLKNVNQVNKFKEVINECTGNVYIHTPQGDVFNLKSALSEYSAIGRLLDEHGDELELFADLREDETRLIRFLSELDKDAA